MANDDAYNDGNGEEDLYPTASVGVWLGLIVLSAISFWCQAAITEERFVPCLNVIALRFNIPDDVAGATLMAAGASSPELFASFTSLFVTHSSLGIGTIVGSEIFNQLIICAGAIMATRNHELYLNPAILMREIFFYALALVLLLVALRDRRSKDDDESGHDYIFIRFENGLLLMGGYILYIIVLAYFDKILAFWNRSIRGRLEDCSPWKPKQESSLPGIAVERSSSLLITSLPFLRQVALESPLNFQHHDDSFASQSDNSPRRRSLVAQLSTAVSEDSSAQSMDVRTTFQSLQDAADQPPSPVRPGRKQRAWSTFLLDSRKPKHSAVCGLEDIESEPAGFSCFLWQRSRFYSKARVAIHAWQLRWFTFHFDKITSVPDQESDESHIITYPPFDSIEVDEAHLLVRIINTESGVDYILMAPSEVILRSVIESCMSISRQVESEVGDQRNVDPLTYTDPMIAEREPSLISFPHGESLLVKALHVFLFPIKLLMHYTVPDIRCMREPQLGVALFSVIACIGWLLVSSYAMVASLEYLGALMRISSSVIGITISAAGTSLPNYVGSQVAARQGLGNMAVSNVFGSNTFNILVGLGLPWLLYTACFGEYSDLRDDEITESVLVMVAILLGFVVLVFLSKFALYGWHAYTFVVTYVAYLIYAVGQLYV